MSSHCVQKKTTLTSPVSMTIDGIPLMKVEEPSVALPELVKPG